MGAGTMTIWVSKKTTVMVDEADLERWPRRVKGGRSPSIFVKLFIWPRSERADGMRHGISLFSTTGMR